MDTLLVSGKKFVKASSIARDLGYTSDYVGQLCRAGKVEAQLVGRSWYVAEESIKEHKANRYRSTKNKTRKTLQKTIKEQPIPESDFEDSPAYLTVYESDDTELKPEVGDTDMPEWGSVDNSIHDEDKRTFKTEHSVPIHSSTKESTVEVGDNRFLVATTEGVEKVRKHSRGISEESFDSYNTQKTYKPRQKRYTTRLLWAFLVLVMIGIMVMFQFGEKYITVNTDKSVTANINLVYPKINFTKHISTFLLNIISD